MRYVEPLYRPPSEAYSLIVQATIGCSHNKCTFCSMYKGKKFRIRSLEEIIEDLNEARRTYRQVKRIFLADGDNPLIIDQPEENLDNKFIYEDLVGAFKEAKKKRQVIIATHNANLVVNTDAEQVIVAEFKDNKISYKGGSIENIDIRNSITLLLEGGKEAFKRREEKYDISVIE